MRSIYEIHILEKKKQTKKNMNNSTSVHLSVQFYTNLHNLYFSF